jgi:hypothetical protein
LEFFNKAQIWPIFYSSFGRFLSKTPEANPTIISYNASAVKIYNTTMSLVGFGKKRSNLHTTYISGVVVVNLEVLVTLLCWQCTT